MMGEYNTDYYKRLTEEELAADEVFQQWVLSPNEGSNNFFTLLVRDFPEEEKKIFNAGKLVQELGNKNAHIPDLTAREKTFLKSIIYRELGFADPGEAPRKKKENRKWRVAFAAAAALAVIALITILLPNEEKQTQPTVQRVYTEPRQIREIILPDSSVVILNGNSSISFSSNFSNDAIREVTLTGNAFFNVKRKVTNTPFIVHANNLDIHVTGTEFNVNAHTKETDVVLTSGNVNITLKGDKTKAANMVAGQMIKLDTVKQAFVTNNVDVELYTAAWQNKEWHFEETTLASVADYIKEYYGVDVIFKNEKIKALTITAVVSVNDFQTLVNILEKTLNINIQVKNQQLIIN